MPYSSANLPPPVRLEKFDRTRTRQSEAAACDINNIMRKYEKTGVIPVDQREAFFADVSSMPDYRTSLDHVKFADDYFMKLPPKTREAFLNDPAVFLDTLNDPSKLDYLKELGVIEKDAKGDPPIPPKDDVEPEPVPE